MTQIDADSVAIWIASPFTPTPLENSNDNRRPTDHTDKPRWAHTTLFCPARARPYIHGRAPLGRVVVPNASACHGNPTQRPALRERRPRQSSSSFNSWEVHISPTYRRQERQNRRASGTSAGEKTGCDERSFGADGLLTGDRQTPDCLSFCLQYAEAHIGLSVRPFVWAVFVSLCLCGCDVAGWICVNLRDLRFLREKNPCSSV